jgi:hypothetical protein
LDAIVHVPGLPIIMGHSATFRFGLWRFRGPALAVEILFTLAGLYFYHQLPVYKKWKRSLLDIMIVLSILGTALPPYFAPGPPSVRRMAFFSLFTIGVIILAGFLWDDQGQRPLSFSIN